MEHLQIADSRRRTGWFWLDNEVFELKLKHTTFVVYCFLVRIADRGSEVACISIRKMAKLLGMSPWTVQKAIKELENLNMIRKSERKTEKGNKIANLYKLTSKEEWVCQNLAQGVPENGTGVCQKMAQGVPKNGTPRESDRAEMTDSQKVDDTDLFPINTYKDQYINKDQYYIDQQHNMCAAETERDFSEENENKIQAYEKTMLNSRNKTLKAKSPKKKKPSALKNFTAAEERAEVKNLVETAKKWGLQTLSPEQAAFFLLNSKLSPEITEKAILKADRDEKIYNPVGYLIDALMINTKKAKHKELLLMEKKEERVGEKVEESPPDPTELEVEPEVEEFLNNLAKELNINIAQEPFKVKREKLAKAIFEKIFSEKAREKVLKDIEDAPGNLKEEIFIALIWSRYLRTLQDDMKRRMLEGVLV